MIYMIIGLVLMGFMALIIDLAVQSSQPKGFFSRLMDYLNEHEND